MIFLTILISLIFAQNTISQNFKSYLNNIIIVTYQECLIYDDELELDNASYIVILNSLISSYLDRSHIDNVKTYYSFDNLKVNFKIDYQIINRKYSYFKEIDLNEK